jgi:hypothetical protein
MLKITKLAALLLLGSVIPVGAQQPSVEIKNFKMPVYPHLPFVARIGGDVKVSFEVAPDGKLVSLKVAGGHPLLWGSTLDSILGSTFSCSNCSSVVTHEMTYTFWLPSQKMVDTECPRIDESRGAYSPKLEASSLDSAEHVTVRPSQYPCPIRDDVTILTHARRPVRAATCLYLWKCGVEH